MNKKVIIIGASGHGKVVSEIVEAAGDEVIGFLDDNIAKAEETLKNTETSKCGGYRRLGQVEDCRKYAEYEFIIAIGNNSIRKRISEFNLNWYTAIHPSAIVSNSSYISEGTVIMPNVVINANAKIGRHCIINTAAIIEHDCRVGDFVHISPNATLCVTTEIGDTTHIGAGTTVINNINVAKECVVGANSVIVKNIDSPGVYVGTPCKRIR